MGKLAINEFGVTTQQEGFCQSYVNKCTSADAYRSSYSTENMKDSTIHKCASDLFKNPKIAGRIAALQTEGLKRNNISMDWVISHLISDYLHAKDNEKSATSARLLELLGRHFGAFKEKSEIAQEICKVIFNTPDNDRGINKSNIKLNIPENNTSNR